MSLLISPATEMAVKSFLSEPSHGLLIIGPTGSGKQYLTEHMAAAILGVKPSQIKLGINYIVINPPENSQIGIDDIRRLKNQTKLKMAGPQNTKSVILINQAENMTTEAQNALLKTLEEPNAGWTIILTTNDVSKLLPTVLSRLQKISVHPVSYQSAKTYFNDIDDSHFDTSWKLSEGYPGLLSALIENKLNHQLYSSVADAKQLLILNTYEKMLKINDYAKDDSSLDQTIIGLDKVLSAGHRIALKNNNLRQAASFLKARKALRAARNNLSRNANVKLNLLELFTKLG